VIGAAADDALVARSQSQASIQDAATKAGVAGVVRFIGVITDRNALSQAYRAASVHVFPVRELAGDPEGFGMVAIEAAAHGLATAAYATGGVVDAVASGVSGRLVPAGDVQSLTDAINDLLDTPLPGDAMRAFAERFAWPVLGARVREVLQ
jgi:phosphatidylinositol alpha-1,6-mannosyltransferase